MPYFTYKAIGRDGKPHVGTVEASGLDWNVTRLPQEGKTFGTKSMETRTTTGG